MGSKKTLFIFLFVFMMIGIVSAAQITVKPTLKNGENALVKISGSFTTPIFSNQIKFYREGHMITQFPQFTLKQIGNDYYFNFTVLDKVPDYYTIVVENAKYKSGLDTVTSNLYENFTILNATVPFTISSPLVVAHDKYSLTLENVISDNPITVYLDGYNSTTQIVQVNATNSTNNSTNSTNVTETIPNSIPIILDSYTPKTLTLTSQADQGFQTITFTYNNESYPVLVYNPQTRIEVTNNQNNTIPINETINQTNNLCENGTLFNGTCYNVTCPNGTLATPNFTNQTLTNWTCVNVTCENGTWVNGTCNGTLVNNTSSSTVGKTDLTCSAQNGTICNWNGGEKCTTSPFNAADGSCCLGKCYVPKKSNTGKIIGWFIILAIVLFGIWFYKKKYSRSGSGKVDLTSIAGPKK